MRNVVLGLAIGVDGYIARRNGAVDFLLVPKDYSTADFFASVDTAIMGRKTLDARQRHRRGFQRLLKMGSCGWIAKDPGAKAPRLSDRFFVGLKPHANPKDQGIDFFSTLFQPSGDWCIPNPGLGWNAPSAL